MCSKDVERYKEIYRKEFVRHVGHLPRTQILRSLWRKPEITQNGCCLHHSIACAFNQACTVRTSENCFESKL